MKSTLLAVKRCLGDIPFLIGLILMIGILPLAATLGEVPEQLPAGVLNLDTSDMAERITARLLENDFIAYTEEKLLFQAVEEGKLDCGIIFPKGLEEKAITGALKQDVQVICSPQSLAEELYLGLVSACLFEEIAPYITAEKLAALNIPQNVVLDAYWDTMEQGYLFSFEILSEDGLPIPENQRAKDLMTGVLAVLLYILITMTVITAVHKDMRNLVPKLGMRKSVTHVLVPDLAIRLPIVCGAMILGLILAEPVTVGAVETDLILPACLYCVALLLTAVVAALICSDTRVLYLLVFVVLVASVVICPLYIDITVLNPAFVWAREFTPIYWLWKIGLLF